LPKTPFPVPKRKKPTPDTFRSGPLMSMPWENTHIGQMRVNQVMPIYVLSAVLSIAMDPKEVEENKDRMPFR